MSLHCSCGSCCSHSNCTPCTDTDVPSSTGKELAVRGNGRTVSCINLKTVRSYIDEIEQGERLLAELRAIEIWDRDFAKRARHETYELLGALCRVRRRIEIVFKLTNLISRIQHRNRRRQPARLIGGKEEPVELPRRRVLIPEPVSRAPTVETIENWAESVGPGSMSKMAIFADHLPHPVVRPSALIAKLPARSSRAF